MTDDRYVPKNLTISQKRKGGVASGIARKVKSLDDITSKKALRKAVLEYGPAVIVEAITTLRSALGEFSWQCECGNSVEVKSSGVTASAIRAAEILLAYTVGRPEQRVDNVVYKKEYAEIAVRIASYYIKDSDELIEFAERLAEEFSNVE